MLNLQRFFFLLLLSLLVLLLYFNFNPYVKQRPVSFAEMKKTWKSRLELRHVEEDSKEAGQQPAAHAIPIGCTCTDSEGATYDFCYHLPENESIHGRRFSCEHVDRMKSLGLLGNVPLDRLTASDIENPVFVTAFSHNHQSEAINLMRSVAKYHPKKLVVAYDLGGIQKSLFKKFDFVEFRSFNFSLYPSYVSHLTEYRWKPIIIAETLAEFGAIWYMDSSVVLTKANLSHVYALVTCRKDSLQRIPLKSVDERDLRESQTPHESGWDVEQWKQNVKECRKAAYLMHGYTGHGIYTATSPETYNFFPTNFDEIRKPKAKMYEAGFIFAVRTRSVIQRIVRWYVLCALEKDCMAGSHAESLRCSFVDDRFSAPPTCHRFDQSVVNLLAANDCWYDRHYYTSEIVDFFKIISAVLPILAVGVQYGPHEEGWNGKGFKAAEAFSKLKRNHAMIRRSQRWKNTYVVNCQGSNAIREIPKTRPLTTGDDE